MTEDYEKDIQYIRRDVDRITKRLDELKSHYVLKTEYLPVQKLVYGVTALILTSTILGMLALILKT